MMAGVYELVARAVVAFTLPKVLEFMGICLADPVAWFAAVIPLAYTYYKREKSFKILRRSETFNISNSFNSYYFISKNCSNPMSNIIILLTKSIINL